MKRILLLNLALVRLIGGASASASRSLSAISFWRMIASQKETARFHDPSLDTITSTMAGSERSVTPTAATKSRRSCAQAGHSTSVCCAVSSSQPPQ